MSIQVSGAVPDLCTGVAIAVVSDMRKAVKLAASWETRHTERGRVVPRMWVAGCVPAVLLTLLPRNYRPDGYFL